MARGLDEHQQRELTAFVNQLADAAGYTTTAEWARDAGYPAPNLSELRNGKAGVDGYNLLRLIRAAAARMDEEPVEAVRAATRRFRRSSLAEPEERYEAERSAEDYARAARQEGLAAEVAALTALVTQGLSQIGKRLDDLDQRLPARERPAQRRRTDQEAAR